MLLIFPSLLLGFAAYYSPGENGLLGTPHCFGNISDVIQTANVSLKITSGCPEVSEHFSGQNRKIYGTFLWLASIWRRTLTKGFLQQIISWIDFNVSVVIRGKNYPPVKIHSVPPRRGFSLDPRGISLPRASRGSESLPGRV
ncbi:group 10 secretory phospholipase A2 isoform X2 [Serinus canaria]|uniref:group 10 secretory phospholipase A2 isoform X2 n=1 Tax=Serinus canaria TaxID=9135 RepID=UPI0021CD0A21|nr:group 10 secretory phospholipase A2 isoform X2 [Serinus canaria]